MLLGVLIMVFAAGCLVGGYVCWLLAASHHADRVVDLEEKALRLENELRLKYGQPPVQLDGGQHRPDAPPSAPPLHMHLADDLTMPIPPGER
jgi:hypothetical protein